MAGAEPLSVAGGPQGVLVLHGFTGNPQSIRGVVDAMADAGFAVEAPLLPGHGTAIEDMVPTRWSDWSRAADSALVALAGRSARVAVVGLSMGGSLACWLATRHPEIGALVLVNPMLDPPADSFRDILRGLLDAGIEVVPGSGSDIAQPGVTELGYDAAPLAAALSLFEALDDLAARLDRVRCPVLVFSSRHDHVVPPESGDLAVRMVGGPVERVWLEHSSHVATLDQDRAELEATAVGFVSRALADLPGARAATGWPDEPTVPAEGALWPLEGSGRAKPED